MKGAKPAERYRADADAVGLPTADWPEDDFIDVGLQRTMLSWAILNRANLRRDNLPRIQAILDQLLQTKSNTGTTEPDGASND